MSDDIADTVMVVDAKDKVIGSAEIGEEVLHRTASLLVFDATDKLLLVKNKDNLWNCLTATPFHGKDEMDSAPETGVVPGVINAVSRSTGVDQPEFVTRVSSGKQMNYILTTASTTAGAMPESEHKWVTKTECGSMLDSCTPLFRCIYDILLKEQWSHIKADYGKIHRSALAGDESKKQGSYGKVITHKESKLRQLMHLSEVWSALKYSLTPLPSNMDVSTPDMEFCSDILVAVSRSFSAVIRQLPPLILTDVLVFYLVLRALDTVEDDMDAFSTHAEKIAHLRKFSANALENPEWCMMGVGQGDERRLLEEFPRVHRVYKTLVPASREIICDITERMAEGMSEFVEKDLGQGTRDVEEYNRYCHFVAGLVGEGLSRLFAVSNMENASLADETHLSDQMGKFLQKTNIIRDFLEDYVDQRAWWPQTVWKKYSATGDLGYFCDQDDQTVRTKSLHCLNELVADALELVPDCLAYMACLQCTEVFKFCAIPQVMAVATLEKLYANNDVFTGVVKIRKGTSVKLILKAGTLDDLHEIFYDFLCRIVATTRKNPDDPSYKRIMAACEKSMDLTFDSAMANRRARTIKYACAALVVMLAVFWQQITKEMVVAALVVLATSILRLYGIGSRTVRSSLKPADLLKDLL